MMSSLSVGAITRMRTDLVMALQDYTSHYGEDEAIEQAVTAAVSQLDKVELEIQKVEYRERIRQAEREISRARAQLEALERGKEEEPQ